MRGEKIWCSARELLGLCAWRLWFLKQTEGGGGADGIGEQKSWGLSRAWSQQQQVIGSTGRRIHRGSAAAPGGAELPHKSGGLSVWETMAFLLPAPGAAPGIENSESLTCVSVT